MNPIENFRAGYIAVVGLPNVGKSTLLNRLLHFKISIVTPKPQTTRKNVLGILNAPQYQMVFIDTPGILEPRYTLQEKMLKSVKSAIADADVLVYMVDAAERRQAPQEVQKQMALTQNKAVILALNKIDLLEKRQLLPLIEQYSKIHPFKAIIPISAEKSDGLGQLLEEIAKNLPFGHPFYPSDYLSDQQERFFVAEIVREKIFKLYGEEIPYSCHVEIEEFREAAPSPEEPQEGKDYIRALILVEKPSQKGILIGKKGQALKKVGLLAREEIEAFLGRPVFLELFVKVAEDWRRKEGLLRRMGY
ncbi:MAG: GTPase Era [Calditrichaceae bacterium]|nr:GTPase Era [Calditrichia bacterium]NUQ42387.1 GTPase Era [Calditrichaceae bacterium]